jgi:hypothetical protein
MIRYRIRKTGRTWKLYHFHRPNGGWHGPVMESSYWRNVAWVATGDPRYQMPGFVLTSDFCYWRSGTNA